LVWVSPSHWYKSDSSHAARSQFQGSNSTRIPPRTRSHTRISLGLSCRYMECRLLCTNPLKAVTYLVDFRVGAGTETIQTLCGGELVCF
jgi:hypothetical protein